MSCVIDARATNALTGGTPAQITTLLTGRREYYVLLDNPAYKSGNTAYVVASATDTNITPLEIPPRSQVLSGPYTDNLPFLYCARTQDIYSTVIAYAQPTGNAFTHAIN